DCCRVAIWLSCWLSWWYRITLVALRVLSKPELSMSMQMALLSSSIPKASKCVLRCATKSSATMLANESKSGLVWQKMEVLPSALYSLPINVINHSCALQANEQEEDGVTWEKI